MKFSFGSLALMTMLPQYHMLYMCAGISIFFGGGLQLFL